LETAYTDIHANPELSMQETHTAMIAAKHLVGNGYEVATGLGKTGVVGLICNLRRAAPARDHAARPLSVHRAVSLRCGQPEHRIPVWSQPELHHSRAEALMGRCRSRTALSVTRYSQLVNFNRPSKLDIALARRIHTD